MVGSKSWWPTTAPMPRPWRSSPTSLAGPHFRWHSPPSPTTASVWPGSATGAPLSPPATRFCFSMATRCSPPIMSLTTSPPDGPASRCSAMSSAFPRPPRASWSRPGWQRPTSAGSPPPQSCAACRAGIGRACFRILSATAQSRDLPAATSPSGAKTTPASTAPTSASSAGGRRMTTSGCGCGGRASGCHRSSTGPSPTTSGIRAIHRRRRGGVTASTSATSSAAVG